MLDDLLSDLKIILAERARRIMYRGTAEILDYAYRPAPVLKNGTEDRIGAFAVRVEPQAVQLAAEALADEVKAGYEGVRGCAIADHHHLCGLGTAFDHNLQIAREALVRNIRVAAETSIDQSTTDDIGDVIYQGVLNNTVRNVNDAVGIELEQP